MLTVFELNDLRILLQKYQREFEVSDLERVWIDTVLGLVRQDLKDSGFNPDD